MVVFVGECSNANAVAHVNEEGAGITVIATVANAGSSPLANVTLDLKAFRKVELFERRCIRYRRRRGERHRAHPPQLGSRGRAGDNRQEQRRGSGARKAAGGEQAPVDNRAAHVGWREPLLIIAAGIAFFIVVVFYYNARTGEEERERKTAEYRRNSASCASRLSRKTRLYGCARRLKEKATFRQQAVLRGNIISREQLLLGCSVHARANPCYCRVGLRFRHCCACRGMVAAAFELFINAPKSTECLARRRCCPRSSPPFCCELLRTRKLATQPRFCR